jgi:ATP-dependent Clp protease ATP-binding subunit ClpA
MRTTPVSSKPRRTSAEALDLLRQLSDRLVGQPKALAQIVPYVQMHQAGLAPEGRPAGVFLLLGPTGTGKTRTVEVLAQALHGSEKAC